MNSTQGDLKLRQVTTADTDQFFELIDRNRERLRNYFPITISMITSREACAMYLEEKVKQIQLKEFFCFVLDDGRMLQGLFFLKNVSWSVPKCELAYFIDEQMEGQGIMSWALGEVTKYCLETLGMNKLYIMTAIDNVGSRKIARKNGYEIEGVLRKDFKATDGALIDMVCYGLVKN